MLRLVGSYLWLGTLLFLAYLSSHLIEELGNWWLSKRLGLIGSAAMRSIDWLPLVLSAPVLLLVCRQGRIAYGYSFFALSSIMVFAYWLWEYEHPVVLQKRWITVAIYFWTRISMVFPLVFFWGWGNQHFSFTKAAVLYPCFGLLAAMTSLLAAHEFATVSSKLFLEIILALQCLMPALFFAGRKLVRPAEPAQPVQAVKLSIAMFLLLVGFVWGSYFLHLSFKMQARLFFPDWSAYQTFMNSHSWLTHTSAFTIGLLGLLLGTYAAYTGRGKLARVATLLCLLAIGGAWLVALGAQERSLWDYPPLFVSLAGISLFRGIHSLLDEVLLELGFTTVPLKSRFTAKVWVDLILTPLAAPLIAFLWWWTARSRDWLAAPPLPTLTTAFLSSIFLSFLGIALLKLILRTRQHPS